MILENKKVKFVVVGVGYIGKWYVEMICCENEVEFVVMVDVCLQEECGIIDLNVFFFYFIDELLQFGLEYDVVNICIFNGLYVEQVLKVFEVKKYVVVEKLMGFSKDVCEKIIFKLL